VVVAKYPAWMLSSVPVHPPSLVVPSTVLWLVLALPWPRPSWCLRVVEGFQVPYTPSVGG
jgi:hypothetical protein